MASDKYNDDTEAELGVSSTINVIALEQKRQKRLERIGLISALTFIGIVIIAAVFTKGEIFSDAVSALQSIEGTRDDGNAILNCRRKANRNTPYCQERRGRRKAQWSAIKRSGDQTPVPFSLHGK